MKKLKEYFRLLRGFTRTGESWRYTCEHCGVTTLGLYPLRSGQVLKVWCCGAYREFRVSWFTKFLMPRFQESPYIHVI